MRRNLRWILVASVVFLGTRLNAQQTAVSQPIEFTFAPLNEISRATNPLGMRTKDLVPELAGYMGLQEAGVLLLDVPADSAAYAGGLRSYDIVLDVDGKKFETAKTLDEFMATRSNSEIHLKLFRRGEMKEVKLHIPTVAEFQWYPEKLSPITLDLAFVASSPIKIYKLGIVSSPVDDVLRSHLNLSPGEGVVLTEVLPDSPASKVGCEVNDVLLELDGKSITSEDKMREQLQEIGSREVLLKLLRRGKKIEVKIQPQLVGGQDVTLNQPFTLGFGMTRQATILGLQDRYLWYFAPSHDPKTSLPIEKIRALKEAVDDLARKVQDVEVELLKQSVGEKPLTDSSQKSE